MVGTLLELAIVLEVKRNSDNKMKNKVWPNGETLKVKGLNEKDSHNLATTTLKTEKIDRIAFISCLAVYSLFNLIYWAHFLT